VFAGPISINVGPVSVVEAMKVPVETLKGLKREILWPEFLLKSDLYG
jgi:hypothetical protein